MVRKQGGMITNFRHYENVVDRCIEKIKEVDPTSLADKIYHITIKTEAYAMFKMDGFDFMTDGNGNFSSVAIAGMTTPEIHNLYFLDDIENCVVCFIY